MIVCHCKVVSDRSVAESVGGGAQTLGQLCRATGAGQDCGGCVLSLKRLLCAQSAAGPAPAGTAGVPAMTESVAP